MHHKDDVLQHSTTTSSVFNNLDFLSCNKSFLANSVNFSLPKNYSVFAGNVSEIDSVDNKGTNFFNDERINDLLKSLGFIHQNHTNIPSYWSSSLVNHINSIPKGNSVINSELGLLLPVFFFKPPWKKIGKWMWNYRKVLQLIYQLRFLIYLLAQLKKLGKWFLRFQVVALIYKHIELIMKHLEKLKVLGEYLLKWKLVRKLLQRIRNLSSKYLRWNVILGLINKIFGSKKK